AEAATYTQAAGDAGSVLQCEVEADNGAAGPGFSASKAILARPIPSPPPTMPPTEEAVLVSGSVDASGGTLTCTTSTWYNKFEPEATFAYRWFENGVEVSGATESTLTVAAGETPLSVQCEALGSKSGDTAVAFSEVVESDPALDPPLPSPLVPPH